MRLFVNHLCHVLVYFFAHCTAALIGTHTESWTVIALCKAAPRSGQCRHNVHPQMCCEAWASCAAPGAAGRVCQQRQGQSARQTQSCRARAAHLRMQDWMKRRMRGRYATDSSTLWWSQPSIHSGSAGFRAAACSARPALMSTTSSLVPCMRAMQLMVSSSRHRTVVDWCVTPTSGRIVRIKYMLCTQKCHKFGACYNGLLGLPGTLA